MEIQSKKGEKRMFFDSHMHTTHSDGKSTLEEMCQRAIAMGAGGITITDHADMNFYESRDTYNRIRGGIQHIRQMQAAYRGELELLCGVELGEYLCGPENAQKILSLTDYDSILCSIHYVPEARWEKPYNRIVFSEDGTDAELDEYLRLYFDLLSRTMDCFDFDVLSHLACPVRYMTTKYGRPTDVMRYAPKIREILQKVIDRKIALEWNTAGLRQNEEIFTMYYQMGGRLVTLGSDAHHQDNIGRRFPENQQALKDCGFTHYHYYKNRTPQPVDL